MVEVNPNPETPERRRFLKAIIHGSALLITAATAIPGIGMLLAPVFAANKRQKRKVVFQKPEDSKSTAFVPARYERQEETMPGLFVKVEKGQPVVLWARCPHAGCAVEWHGADNQFVCPCHQGRFDANGKNVSGPPPRPLDRLNATIVGSEVFVEEPEA